MAKRNKITDENENMFSLKNQFSENSVEKSTLARENLRRIALKEKSDLSNSEQIFDTPAKQDYEVSKSITGNKEEEYSESSEKYEKRSSSNRRSSSKDVIKIDPPIGTDNLKSFNDFDESIFVLDEKRQTYICPVPECGKEFPSLSRIKRHYIIHTDLKPFKCKNKECNRRFSRKDNMLQHYRMHCPYTKNI